MKGAYEEGGGRRVIQVCAKKFANLKKIEGQNIFLSAICFVSLSSLPYEYEPADSKLEAMLDANHLQTVWGIRQGKCRGGRRGKGNNSKRITSLSGGVTIH